MVPKFDQIEIELPTFTISESVPYVASALPYMVYEDEYVSDFALKPKGNPAKPFY